MKPTEEFTEKQALALYASGPQPFIEMQVTAATYQAVDTEDHKMAALFRIPYISKTKKWGKPEFQGYGPVGAVALKLVQLANAEWSGQQKFNREKAKEEKQAERAVVQAKKAEAKRVAEQIKQEAAATEKAAAEKTAKAAKKHHDASNVQKQIKKQAKKAAKPAPKVAKKPAGLGAGSIKIHKPAKRRVA